MRRIPSARLRFVHTELLKWYRKNFRKLPWRETNDPYKILISEVMLQQTQVSRVEEKFHPFIKRFPNVRALSRASRADVVRAWQGMGYNNRAIRLRELARIVSNEHGGRLPTNVGELEQLPGIGRYTAHAIACFAHNQNVPVVDVNVRRVLSRLFWKMKSVADRRPEKEIWQLAERILPTHSHNWNQGLMELGATICTARKPQCTACPLRSKCSSQLLVNQPSLTVARHHSKKREPVYAGLPQRLWRGKIVEALRHLDGRETLTLSRLGTAIKSNFTSRELRWLDSVVDSLVRDGVIERVGRSRHAKIALTE